jgi:hypothetical protein
MHMQTISMDDALACEVCKMSYRHIVLRQGLLWDRAHGCSSTACGYIMEAAVAVSALALVGVTMSKLIHSILTQEHHAQDEDETAQILPLVLWFLVTTAIVVSALRKLFQRWLDVAYDTTINVTHHHYSVSQEQHIPDDDDDDEAMSLSRLSRVT